jgi:hypothetical protein
MDAIKPQPLPKPEAQPPHTPKPDLPATEPPKSEGGRVSRWAWLTKRRILIIALAAVITLGSATAIWYTLTHKTKPVAQAVIVTPKPTPAPTPVPTTAPAPLTGLPVAPSAATAPVVGVMIENLYPYARPQSGLGEAGEVYEALAEGGITRFLGLFQEPLPSSLGPVRSLRPYYLDWGLEHNIPVAHAGGSQPALAEIGPLGMKDINALKYDGSYFYRITTRFAPHNLYTNSTLLTQLIAKLGFATVPTFTPLPRKDDAPATNPPHTDIKIPFSYAAYNAEYKYNAAANDYLRFEGGAPQTDMLTGKQIQVKNVVIQFVPVTYGTQDDGDPDTDYHLIGTGQALVFEDGNVIPGTWSKTTDAAQTQIDDTTGTPIKFNRGNTWFSVVPTGTDVTY